MGYEQHANEYFETKLDRSINLVGQFQSAEKILATVGPLTHGGLCSQNFEPLTAASLGVGAKATLLPAVGLPDS